MMEKEELQRFLDGALKELGEYEATATFHCTELMIWILLVGTSSPARARNYLKKELTSLLAVWVLCEITCTSTEKRAQALDAAFRFGGLQGVWDLRRK